MNAKEEFLEHTKDKVVKCACIRLKDGAEINLLEHYSFIEYDEFLEKLDFEYNNGFGSQELFGIIWHNRKKWSERGEYDGSEWWEFKECPSIPKHLRRP